MATSERSDGAALLGANIGSSSTIVRIDPVTGAATFYVTPESGVIGLAYDPTRGVLYASDFTTLYTLDLNDGSMATIGSTGLSSITALAFDPNTDRLFAAQAFDNRLYVVNTTTGAATNVGGGGPAAGIPIAAMTFDPTANLLYATNNNTDSLITINTSTGVASTVGALGFQQVVSLAFDPLTNRLYGEDNLTDQLLLINTTTGAATAIGPVNYDSIQEMVFAPVPEPASKILLSVPLFLLGFRRRFGRRLPSGKLALP